MQYSTSKKESDRPDRKGFTFHVGENYVGYITIAEFDRNGNRVMDEAMAHELAKPEVMAGVLTSAELRPYSVKGVADNKDLSALITNVTSTTPSVATQTESPLPQ